MSKIYTYHAAYIDENFVRREIEIESTAKLAERKRSFQFECTRNGWEFVYFERVS